MPTNRCTVKSDGPHILIHVWIDQHRHGNPDYTIRLIDVRKVDELRYHIALPKEVWGEVRAAVAEMDELPL